MQKNETRLILDKSYFIQKIHENKNSMFRIAKSILNNTYDIEDAVCSAVYKAYKKRHTLKNENAFKSWILRITINEATVRSDKSIIGLLERYRMIVTHLEPYFMFNIDGIGDKVYHKESESYLIDDYSYSSIQKYTITDPIPDKFKLKMSVYVSLLKKRGDWSFLFNIDKSSIQEDSMIVYPEIKKEIKILNNDEIIKFDVTVKKVSITPFGEQILIDTNGFPFIDFVIKDENGTYFPTINQGCISNNLNVIEFICLNKDAKEINLIPVITDNKTMKTFTFGRGNKLPDKIELSELGGYNIKNISANNNEFTIEFMPYGAILPRMSIINNALGIVGENGEDIITFGNPDYNKDTGTVILKSEYEGTRNALLNKIKGFRHIYIPNFKLIENNSINIKLK